MRVSRQGFGNWMAAAAVVFVAFMAIAPQTGAAEARTKAPVGVWSGGGGDFDYGYAVVAVANGPDGKQQAIFAMDSTDPGTFCQGGPAVIAGPGEFELHASGDGQMRISPAIYICSDTNAVPSWSPIEFVLQYEHSDRWRDDRTEGFSDWFVRRCVDPNDPDAIVGTDDRDELVGTSGNDILDGRKGNDRLIGKGGLDILCGAQGKDKLIGKAGTDVILGGGGNDRGVGGTGVDFILGGGGRDTLLGGAGTDFLLGEGKNDVIKGQAGPNDLAHGGPGPNDTCIAEKEVACEN